MKMSTIQLEPQPPPPPDISNFVLPNNQTFIRLHCQYEFRSMTEKQKLYVNNYCKACWKGWLIALVQCSPESPLIFALLHRVLLGQTLGELRTKVLAADISNDDFQAFLIYVCGFMANAGNYKGVGGTKIIPNLPKETFKQIIELSDAYANNGHIKELLEDVEELIYALGTEYNTIGLPPNGITTYWNNGFDKKNIAYVFEFILKRHMNPLNCRVYKYKYERNIKFKIQIASADVFHMPRQTFTDKPFKTVKFSVQRGGYSKLLECVNEHLSEAKLFARDDCEFKRLELFIRSFQTGDLNHHKNSLKIWVNDKEAVIETFIGFLSKYRDPFGQFAQMEGFVGIVNKELSSKYQTILVHGGDILKLLPWPSAFENEEYVMPDYKVIDLIAYAGNRMPFSKNFPNYEFIRLENGSKNFFFRNISNVKVLKESYKYLRSSDSRLVFDYIIKAFEVYSCLRELFGHTSGKLFRLDKNCFFNFDCMNVKNPLNGCPIVSWYTLNDTYVSKFTDIAIAFEECRAVAVGLYLSIYRIILAAFGHSELEEQDNVIYVIWLYVIWSGMSESLIMYQPETKLWKDAHCQARYVIFQLMLQAKEDFVTIKQNNENDYFLALDGSKISTVGRKALKDFLVKMQVYKSTGNVNEARKLLSYYSDVPENSDWLIWRESILLNREAESIFVQPNVKIENGRVEFITYEDSCEGCVQSWLERFPNTDIDDILAETYKKHKDEFKEVIFF